MPIPLNLGPHWSLEMMKFHLDIVEPRHRVGWKEILLTAMGDRKTIKSLVGRLRALGVPLQRTV